MSNGVKVSRAIGLPENRYELDVAISDGNACDSCGAAIAEFAVMAFRKPAGKRYGFATCLPCAEAAMADLQARCRAAAAAPDKAAE